MIKTTNSNYLTYQNSGFSWYLSRDELPLFGTVLPVLYDEIEYRTSV